MGLGNGPLDVPGEPPRQGIQRRSQAANTLLQKPELGKVRTPPGIGVQHPRACVHARQVIALRQRLLLQLRCWAPAGGASAGAHGTGINPGMHLGELYIGARCTGWWFGANVRGASAPFVAHLPALGRAVLWTEGMKSVGNALVEPCR
jgi:hypothetical protein